MAIGLTMGFTLVVGCSSDDSADTARSDDRNDASELSPDDQAVRDGYLRTLLDAHRERGSVERGRAWWWVNEDTWEEAPCLYGAVLDTFISSKGIDALTALGSPEVVTARNEPIVTRGQASPAFDLALACLEEDEGEDIRYITYDHIYVSDGPSSGEAACIAQAMSDATVKEFWVTRIAELTDTQGSDFNRVSAQCVGADDVMPGGDDDDAEGTEEEAR